MATVPDNESLLPTARRQDLHCRSSLDVFLDYPAAYYTMKLSSSGEAQPNIAHRGWQTEDVKVKSAVVTQNIDGLHQAAGSKRVFELHETRFYCPECGHVWALIRLKSSAVWRRSATGAVIRPDIVFTRGPDMDTAVSPLTLSSLIVLWLAREVRW